jgi:general secretion pathway protein F
MKTFRYRAVTSTGQLVEADVDAVDPADVARALQSQGCTPLRIRAATHDLLAGKTWSLGLSGRGPSQKERARHLHELATLLGAGMPLDGALQLLTDAADGRRRRSRMQQVVDRVRGGASLADALAASGGFLSPPHLAMVRAGEAGGTLESVLGRIAELIERSLALRARIRLALFYPTILLGMVALSIAVLFGYVVPSFQPFFESAGAALPLPTRVVVAAAHAVEDYGTAALIGGLLSLLALRVALGLEAGRLYVHRALLRAPLLGAFVARVEVTRFARTMGTLLRNGVALLQALDFCREGSGNTYLARRLYDVREQVKAGHGLAQQLHGTGCFPLMATRLIRVGEESGRLEDMLLRLADMYDAETERALQRFLAILTPSLTVVFGLVVAFVIAAVLMALLSVNELALQ